MIERVNIYADLAFDLLTIVQAAKATEDETLRARYMEKVIERIEKFCVDIYDKLPKDPVE